MIDDQHNTTSILNQTDSEIGPASKRRKKTRRQTAQKGTKKDKQNEKDLNYEKEDGKDEEAFRRSLRACLVPRPRPTRSKHCYRSCNIARINELIAISST